MMLSIFANKMEGKNKIKMDSYDLRVHSIKFHLYDMESSRTFNMIKDILKYNTILFIR